MRVAVVTNDFPPRIGGINDYVAQLVRRLPSGTVTVIASRWPGDEAHDRAFQQEVVRLPTSTLLPTPGVAREVHALLRARRPAMVLFGAIWPLGHLGPGILRRCDIAYGGFAHGLELTGARVPGLLRGIGRDASLLTAVSDWARRRLEPAFGWNGRMALLPSGIDADAFRPDVSDVVVRERHGLGDAPVIACVSRLVPRKGQDLLIATLPRIRAALPDVRLLIVGSGPDHARLRRLAQRSGSADHIVFTGAVPYAELPAHFRAGTLFAMPCRARRLGLDVEALGAVFLQAAAVGRPVLAGDSGGAPEAVRDCETGFVVDPHDAPALADRCIALLDDPARADAMGRAGAAWVHREWSWDAMTARLQQLLHAGVAG